MRPLTIDLRGVASGLLPSDNPVLTAAVQEALDATRPMTDSAGFDNKI
jgi:hypothetical protein